MKQNDSLRDAKRRCTGKRTAKYRHFDIAVIGGGFYGCTVARELNRLNKRVLVLEKEADLMQRASYTNQARIHQGYHYPRSILTAHRSRINFDRFVREFSECIYSDFEHYYAIGRKTSKTSADQFRQFCELVGAPLGKASKKIKGMFDSNMIDDVFLVREPAFDAVKLRSIMVKSLKEERIDVKLNSEVSSISPDTSGLKIKYASQAETRTLTADYVINCTYSQINKVMEISGLPMVPLKHEFAEMALVQAPEYFQHMGFTVMDGPFFSIMPFPARGLHSLSHVRYTPHQHWRDQIGRPYMDAHKYLFASNPRSRYAHMLKDSERYLPALKECRYVESLWEIKTVLPQSEFDDSRPILFQQAEKHPNVISIMGGKIDNIFDIREKLRERFIL